MIEYLVSLFMGLAVGAAYGLVQVRSPAPPMIALVGLFGMVLGQQAIDTAKRHFVLKAQTYIRHDVNGVAARGGQNKLELRE
jgi:XapX domain-containing protein